MAFSSKPASSSKQTSSSNEVQTTFNPGQGEGVYDYFIRNYLTRWYQAKTVTPYVYNLAMKELALLNKRKAKQANKDDIVTKQAPESRNLQLENDQLKRKIHALQEDLSETYMELQDTKSRLHRMKEDLNNSAQEVNDLKIRLSKFATDKLRDNNPDLADLSDINRPTELGKRFSEIYDNEWSDAFENIAKKDESENVRILHQVVVDAFHYSGEVFKGQVPQIRGILLQSKEVQQKVSISKNEQMIKALNGLRMELSTETARNVAQEYSTTSLALTLREFGIKTEDIDPALRKYAFKCAEVCWLLLMCNDRLSLSEDKVDVPFDVETYNPFTRRLSDIDQPTVDFCVWPALCQDCGVLVKGVAQPKGRKRKPLDLQR